MLINPIILAIIGVGWLFIRYLINRDRGSKEPASGLWAAGVAGLIAVVLAVWLESIYVFDTQSPGRQAFLIALIEESAKLIPLSLWIYGKKYFNEQTDGIIYFGIGGMVFGVTETIGYSLVFGDAVGIIRLLTIPFLHAGFCVCFGWVLARKKVLGGSWLPVFLGFAAAVGLHALYDFGLMYGSGPSIVMSLALTVVGNLLVFRLYDITEHRDRKLGLSASHRQNWYCPHCGTPNPQQQLFCTRCGQRT